MDQQTTRNSLARVIAAGHPVAVLGAPGIGKTAIVREACNDAGAVLLPPVYTVCSDPMDAGGVLWPDAAAGVCHALPKLELATALAAKERTVIFLDDFAQAAPAVQNSWGHLIYARQGGDRTLPDCVSFVIAANRRTDQAGSGHIVSTILSRCLSVVTMTPTLAAIEGHALASGWHPAIMHYLRQRPDALYTEAPKAGEAYPCPRSWEHTDEVLRLDLGVDAEQEMIAGAIGAATATEFAAELEMMREKISAEKALSDPCYPLPKSAAHMIALATACAHYAATDVRVHMDNVMRLAQRLTKSRGEFAAAMLSDLVRRAPAIARMPQWLQIAQSDLGELMMGRGK